jgi:amidohydrolase
MRFVDQRWSDVITEATTWRHHLHQHPELAFTEYGTADFVASKLSHFGLKVHRGLGRTGVVGTLVRGTSRRSIGIRADMDALPIQEQTGAAHASRTPGVMHACGHDGHVAMLLAAARICAELEDIDGTVHFIFQPAEEAEGGGRRMVEEGLFLRFPCDAVYALHNWPTLPLGTCVVRDGPMMAALAVFEIVIRGRGCHGAMPHEGVDPVVGACHIVTALQSVISRNVGPSETAVISVTQVHAGDSWNVICDSCVIRGTTRWFNDHIGDLIERRIGELSRAIAEGFGCEARFEYMRRFPATINDAGAANLIREAATMAPNGLKLLDVPPSTASEDFAFMLQAVRGAYIWLGSGKSDVTHGLHSSRYDFNDDLLPTGVTLWVSLVREALRTA